jgi:iron complex outermembrane receptor protein
VGLSWVGEPGFAGVSINRLENNYGIPPDGTSGEPQDNAGENESRTPGYVRLDVGAQYQVKAFQEANLLLFAKDNNLLNDNIRNSTSYLRNFAPEPGRGAEVGIRVSY